MLIVGYGRDGGDHLRILDGQKKKRKERKKSKREGSWVSLANPPRPRPPRNRINYKCTYQMIMKRTRRLARNRRHLRHPDHSIEVFALWEVGSFDFEGMRSEQREAEDSYIFARGDAKTQQGVFYYYYT